MRIGAFIKQVGNIAKRHWLALVGSSFFLPDILRGIILLLDWRGRIDVLENQLGNFQWAAPLVSFFLSPPPWTVFVLVPLGLLLIYLDLQKRRDAPAVEKAWEGEVPKRRPFRRTSSIMAVAVLITAAAGAYLHVTGSRSNSAQRLGTGEIGRVNLIYNATDWSLIPVSNVGVQSVDVQRESTGSYFYVIKITFDRTITDLITPTVIATNGNITRYVPIYAVKQGASSLTFQLNMELGRVSSIPNEKVFIVLHNKPDS